MKTLVLNSNWMPIRVIDWKRAFVIFFRGRAEVLELHNKQIKTTSGVYYRPAVIRLIDYRKMPKTTMNFSKRSVLIRDDYTCQYCGARLSSRNTTVDHVIPKHRGGPTDFTNVVACCFPCNSRKGSKMPNEFKPGLRKTPKHPKPTDYVFQTNKIEEVWKNYIPKGLIDG